MPSPPSDAFPLRIAMWCGPRNISTAMMRAWENRPDTFVVDEPFYAHYLATSGADHPLREEVIAAYETDWHSVVEHLTRSTQPGKAISYQKQMSHHFLPGVGRAWLSHVTNCFLIREPAEMLASYLRKMPWPDFEATGYPQLGDIFRHVSRETGQVPPVLDAHDVVENPRRILGLLCDRLGVPFLDAMLQWPAGPRTSDGLWASYWYPEVYQTTTFGPYHPRRDPLPPELDPLVRKCREVYDELHAARLQ